MRAVGFVVFSQTLILTYLRSSSACSFAPPLISGVCLFPYNISHTRPNRLLERPVDLFSDGLFYNDPLTRLRLNFDPSTSPRDILRDFHVSQTLKNTRKHSKTLENIRKHSKTSSVSAYDYPTSHKRAV